MPHFRPLALGLSALLLGSSLRSDPTYANPILAGDWSDPGMIRVGDDYYSCRSSFGWQPGIPIVHSRDLVHWEYIGHAFTTLESLKPGDTRGGVWGVEMGYNPNTKEFLIYSATREGTLYVFHAKSPGGPYETAVVGKNLGIDPGFFADADGKLYLVLSLGDIFELSRDGLKIERTVARVNLRQKFRFFEGPAIYKRDGWYYLLFSDGGTLPREPSTVSTLRARSLAGPWTEDPGNPVMFSTDNHAQFEAPAHGSLVELPDHSWWLTFHAHETRFYSLGRETLLEPVTWTEDGWWRPLRGKVPSAGGAAPALPQVPLNLAQSDEFNAPKLGLQWFFTCPPDLSGKSWSLTEAPGVLRIHSAPGDLGDLSALPAIFQQRVIDKKFSVETEVNFDAKAGHESAGLHFFHDPGMNFWLATTVSNGEKQIAVGKFNNGTRSDLWSVPNPYGATVHLKIAVDGEESAQFFFSSDGHDWKRLGETIYFGGSGMHLRDQRRGDPDLGWVGRYKDPTTPADIKSLRPGGNVWTGTTFGIFAVRDGAEASKPADFKFVHVTK